MEKADAAELQDRLKRAYHRTDEYHKRDTAGNRSPYDLSPESHRGFYERYAGIAIGVERNGKRY